MKNTILSKVKDNGKFRLSLRSNVTYTKNKKVKYSISNSGSIKKGRSVIVITSNCSGRSFEKSGTTNVWPLEFIVNKSTGSTVARKTK